MAEMKQYSEGSFCWVDLVTTDAEAAKAFYCRVMGWSAEDMPTDSGIPYTMLSHAGKEIAGLYTGEPDKDVPPHWAAYVRVEQVDAVAEKARSLGATVVMEPMDVMQYGRMCFIQDPTGAILGLWQAGSHFGAELDNQVGARSWCELQTRDTGAAGAFYKDLFGWESRTKDELMGGRYVLFRLDGADIGGMLQIQESWGPVPPNWAVYFGVDDCDGTIESAKQAGGKVVMEPMEIENVGRFAFLADPQGAVFALIQFA